ncbi:MAG: hypothetical protein EXS00_03905 [Phycisphaerales bacterium]|nr:hypothetical protein [Phycisphaerales bacterium]
MQVASVIVAIMCAGTASTPLADSTTDHYQRAFDLLSLNGAAGLLTPEEQIALGELADPNMPRGMRGQRFAGAEQLVTRLAPVWDSLLQAAEQEKCDWSLDRSKGMIMEMRHLGDIRVAARALEARARLALDDGDTETAAESARICLKMTSHLSQDRTSISSALAMAVSGRAINVADSVLDSGNLSVADLTRLKDATSSLAGDDPFRCAEAISGEVELLVNSLSTPEGYAEALKLVEPVQQPAVASGEDAGDADAGDAPTISEDDLKSSVDEVSGWYARGAKTMTMKDPAQAQAAMAAIESEIQRSDNVLKAFLPSMEKLLERKQRSEVALKAFVTRLDSALAIAASTKDQNAAELYFRIGRVAASLDGDRQTTLELVRVLGSNSPEEELASARKITTRYERSVLVALEEAAAVRRVSFDPGVAGAGPNMGMSVLPQVRAAVRMVLADAAAECAKLPTKGAGEREQRSAFVARRIAIAFRVAAHIASDPSLSHSVWAMSICDEAAMALVSALEREALDAEGRTRVAVAAEVLARADPFQIQAASEADREKLARRRGSSIPEADARVKSRRMEQLLSLTPTQLLALACGRDGLLSAVTDEVVGIGSPDALGIMVRPTDIFDLGLCLQLNREARLALDQPFFTSGIAEEVSASSPTLGLTGTHLLDVHQRDSEAQERLVNAKKALATAAANE